MKKLLLLPTIIFAAHLFAGNTDVQKKVYHAQHVNPHPPTIDGRLDDSAWEKVEWKGDFIQREPDDGAAPSQKTAFKIVFDDKNLYVGIRAFDTEPDEIVRRVTRRDRFDGDWVEINIDSYFDHRTGFSFTVNAAGVKGDEYISNDGDNWDSSWDPIWFADVAIDDQGWTAEIKIPFSQLRFANKDEHVWGLQVQRRLFRKEERSVWQYIQQNSGGWVSYFGELRGLKDISASRRVEILPYTVTDTRRFPKEAGNPFVTGSENNFSGGADAKVAVTSDLTLDVTINPDFGQVEADPSEVNLTAFETFFPEKRPFFIEGKNILDYRLMGGDGGFANDRLFYSRRIGRRPQYSPDLKENEEGTEYSQQPDNTSIMTAMKLTGKTRGGFSIGILNAVTQRESAHIDFNGHRRQESVEPLTNHFVGRVQKDFDKGNTSLGGMFTAMHRNIDESQLDFLNRSAYSGGVDFRRQWDNKTYWFEAKGAFSHIHGNRQAITRAQEASQRYFQRPDADYVTLDTTRTSLSGHGGFLNVGRGGNHNLRGSAGVMWRSPGLELNDLGFLRQADRVLQWTWLGYRWTKPFGIFRSLRVNFNQWAGWNFGGEMVFKGGNINGGGQLKNYWNIWGGINREGSDLSTSALRGGPALKTPGAWNNWYSISSDSRKNVQFGLGGFNSWADEGGSRTNNFRFWVRLRPVNAMQLRINPFYTFSKRDLQYITTEDFLVINAAGEYVPNGDARYLFGRLDQKTFGITIRLDYSITPNLSIQYYGQPFVSAGKYSELKRITESRADVYGDRFQIFADDKFVDDAEIGLGIDETGDGKANYPVSYPDFNFRQFRSNLVVRWEYNPGSTLFLVWTQERNGDAEHGNFSLGDDFGDLFNDDATNVFLLKVSRWFSL
ncbi:MAG: DUF5916 domain-containing protein [bacterium]